MWSKWQQTQPIATRMLMNSLTKERLGHALLFHGQPLGVQLELARFIIQFKLCHHPDKAKRPCETCSTCERIRQGIHPDVVLIEPDGATIKKEQIQKLQHDFAQTSFETDEQFYILYSAEMMTIQAANSLLKFLEEPVGKQTAFLLVANPKKLLPTILSRVQTIQLLPPNQQQRVAMLVQQGLDERLVFYANVLTADYEQVQTYVQDGEFQALVQDLELYLQQLEIQGQPPLIAQIGLEKWFNKRARALEVIQLLVAVYEQAFHRNATHLPIAQTLMEQLSVQICQQRLEKLLQLETTIRGNALLMLALTGYHIELTKGSGTK